MKKLLILLVMLFLGVTLLLAQAISEYTYATATNGSLQDMSTGTTALLGPGTYYDDQSSVVANIGFTFTFGGTGYTQFSGNSNGQMALAITCRLLLQVWLCCSLCPETMPSWQQASCTTK
jgi:hypothetical protein